MPSTMRVQRNLNETGLLIQDETYINRLFRGYNEELNIYPHTEKSARAEDTGKRGEDIRRKRNILIIQLKKIRSI